MNPQMKSIIATAKSRVPAGPDCCWAKHGRDGVLQGVQEWRTGKRMPPRSGPVFHYLSKWIIGRVHGDPMDVTIRQTAYELYSAKYKGKLKCGTKTIVK